LPGTGPTSDTSNVFEQYIDVFCLLFCLQVHVEGPNNLLEPGCFEGLDVLYFKSSHSITADALVGFIAGSDESSFKMCGSVLPLSLLQTLCEASLTPRLVLVWPSCINCIFLRNFVFTFVSLCFISNILTLF
jgi:hypothetical protein